MITPVHLRAPNLDELCAGMPQDGAIVYAAGQSRPCRDDYR